MNEKRPASSPGDQLKLDKAPKEKGKVDPLYRQNVRVQGVHHGKKKGKRHGSKR